jgi:ubiquinone/menaquinone biosynthesis C-methylase UbiE
MNSTSKYTFGDSDRAAERLSLLAQAYERASRALLSECAPKHAEHAIDLGCGPGYTTRLVHEVLGARRTTGLDSSARYIEMAARTPLPGTRYVVHDVLATPYPIPAGDLLFCRHLLTHLPDLRAALLAFAELARPGAVLLIQETESLSALDPTLLRYYECVSSMQAAHRQRTHVGPYLALACDATPFRIESSSVRVLQQDARVMARLHRMNLATWRHDERAKALFDAGELDGLDTELGRIEVGETPAAPVENALRELVLRRTS